jgi:hypothetical protein
VAGDDDARRRRVGLWEEIDSFKDGKTDVRVVREANQSDPMTYVELRQTFREKSGPIEKTVRLDMLQFELLIEKAREVAQAGGSADGNRKRDSRDPRIGNFREGDATVDVMVLDRRGKKEPYVSIYQIDEAGGTQQILFSLETAKSINLAAQAVERLHDQRLKDDAGAKPSRGKDEPDSPAQTMRKSDYPADGENFLSVARLKEVNAEGETLASVKVVRSFQISYDVKLMSGLEHAHQIPKFGTNELIIAEVQGIVHVRMFDKDNGWAIYTDEKWQPEKADKIHQLGMYLKGEWPEGVPKHHVLKAVEQALDIKIPLSTEREARMFADKDPNFVLWPKASPTELKKDAVIEVTREDLENHEDNLKKLETKIQTTLKTREVETEHFIVGVWNDQSFAPTPNLQVKWDGVVMANGEFKDFNVTLTGAEKTPGPGENPLYVLVKKDDGQPPRHRIEEVFQNREAAVEKLPIAEGNHQAQEQNLATQQEQAFRKQQEDDRTMLSRHRI